jgi:hypothetical protein
MGNKSPVSYSLATPRDRTSSRTDARDRREVLKDLPEPSHVKSKLTSATIRKPEEHLVPVLFKTAISSNGMEKRTGGTTIMSIAPADSRTDIIAKVLTTLKDRMFGLDNFWTIPAYERPF